MVTTKTSEGPHRANLLRKFTEAQHFVLWGLRGNYSEIIGNGVIRPHFIKNK